jgi:chromosome segregation ATPase
LETSLAEKTQLYETAVTQLRSVTSQVVQSKQEVAVALDERNNLFKSHEQQIAIKEVTISRLTANVRQHEELLRGTKADLNQKLARITELEFTYQQQQAIIDDSRRQVLALNTQVQSKDTTIDSLKERAGILEAKSKTDVAELEKSTNHYESQLTQANARISDLNCQLNVLSNNSVTLQGKLDNAIREKLAIATQLHAARQEGEELQSQAQEKDGSIKSLQEHNMMLEAKFTSKNDETKKLGSEKQTLQAQLTQTQNNLFESTSLLVVREQTITQLTTELRESASILEEKDALVARLEIALDTAQQRALTAESSLKEKDDEITALKSLFDARDVMMKPHEPKGNHPRFGMMNLRGCAWNWHIHCLVDKSFSPWTIHFA